MGIRPSRLERAVAAVVLASFIAIVSVAGGGEAVGASPIASPRCERPSSTTLLETTKVRLYAMPTGTPVHLDHRNPSIAGRPVFGCLQATGRSRLLDLPELKGERHAYWVEVGPRTVAANGPLVAYAYTQYYLDTHETWIRVRNLNTGAVVRGCYVGSGMAPHRHPHVTEIILRSDGEVGWKAEGEEPDTRGNQGPGCNPLG